MRKGFFVVAALVLSGRLLSQTFLDSTLLTMDEFPFTELTRVVITSHKTEQRQAATGKVMNVITPSQISRSGGRNIAELLNMVSGISVNGANNNFGTNQTVNIRGASPGNVLILLDGVPVNDPSVIYNYYDLNLVPIEQVEKIEILKGGQSTLYGSDAVAGVINIITKKPKLQRKAVNAGISAGSYGTIRSGVGISGTGKKSIFNVQYNNQFSNGFSTAYDSTGNNHFDKDGSRQHAAFGRFDRKLGKRLAAYLLGRFSAYETDIDAAAFRDDRDFTSSSRNLQAGAGLTYKFGRGEIRSNYLFNTITRRYTDDSTDRTNDYAYFSDGKYVGTSHYAETFTSYKWEHVHLLAGIDFRNHRSTQDYFSLGVFGPYSSHLPADLANLWQLSPYGSLLVRNDKGLSAEAGARWNYHSEYGNNFTYNLNPCYFVNNRLKLFVNLYTSFKAPNLYQLFDPFSGNAGLEAEKSTLAEVGAEYLSRGDLRLRAVYFYRDTKDAIQYILTDPVFFTYQYQNINRQENGGLEFEANYKTGRWVFDGNYTYTTGRTRSGYDETGSPLGKDTSYNNLYRIPKHGLNFSTGLSIKKLFLRLQLRLVGKRFEAIYAASPVELDSYHTIDFYADYGFSGKVKLFLDLKNITNQRYFDILGYNSRRFNFMTGLSLNF